MTLGRRHVHKNGEAHTPANIPFVILGTGMLWFGWFGFNAGSALSASGQAAMAFATAAGGGTIFASPTPRTPKGCSGSGTSTITVSIIGRSRLVGMR